MSLHHTPKPLLIACGILQPEIEALIARGEIDAQDNSLNKHLHEDYQKLPKIYFLTPAFLEFSEKLLSGNPEADQACFNMLRGIILLDSLGDLNRYQDRIRNFSRQIGLPVLEHRNVSLEGLKTLILEALQRRRP